MANIGAWIAHMESLKYSIERDLDEMAGQRDDRSKVDFPRAVSEWNFMQQRIDTLKKEQARRKAEAAEQEAAAKEIFKEFTARREP